MVDRDMRHPADGRQQPASRYLRPAVAGLLLLAAISGISAATPGFGAGGPWRGHPAAIGIALEVTLALVLLALTVLARRSPRPGPLRAELRYLIRWATITLMIIIVAVGIGNYAGSRHGSTLLKLLQRNGKSKPQPRPVHMLHDGHSLNLIYLWYALIAAVLAAAIGACWLAIASHRPARPAFAEVLDDDRDDATLRRAVESGRVALQAVDEARAAIIACYLAMEGSLATAGTARAAAETPDELLARAITSGPLRGPAAAELTALFYEARFSTHSLSDNARAAAVAALDGIAAELRDPAVTGRATTAAAGSGQGTEALR